MSAADTELATRTILSERVALVQAQLAPIRSRRALLDSYRRESLCRLASTAHSTNAAADVLDIAYALRWAELQPEAVADRDEWADLELVNE
jgi:hypothetical protein